MENMIEEGLHMEAKVYKTLGIVLLILGLVAIAVPEVISGIIVFIIAFVLTLMGGLYLSLAVYGQEDEKNWITWVKAFIMLGVGVLMMTNPRASVSALALILAVFFMGIGFLSLFAGIAVKPGEGWQFFIVEGIVAIIAAIILLVGWPENSLRLMGLIVGLVFVANAVTMFVIGTSVDKMAEAL